MFELDYLGSIQQTFTLSFSRPGAQVIGQYYNFVRLGLRGFRSVMENSLSNARLLRNWIENTGWYTCISDIHRQRYYIDTKQPRQIWLPIHASRYVHGLPVVAFTFSSEFKRRCPGVLLSGVSRLLRQRQFMVACKRDTTTT